MQREPPRVTLRNAFRLPYASAISAARTCYSPRVIGPEEVSDRQLASIGSLTFDAGHHTVFQHAHFEFGLEAISRQLVWSTLHSYPFYNSEQSSQRYVRLDEPRAYVPPLAGEQLRIYEAAIVRAWEHYRTISALLVEDTRAILTDLRHLTAVSAPKKRKRVAQEAEKKAIEIARYVIPIAAFTSMVHTISGVTLHRLWRLMQVGDTPGEATEVIGRMVDCVRRIDPDFFERIGDGPLPAEDPSTAAGSSSGPPDDAFRAEFDATLEGRTSRLVSYDPAAESRVADAYRFAFGLSRTSVSDDEAIARILDPARNRYRLEKLNVTFHTAESRPLHHARYTFHKKLSHTADSQEQRHRMLPGSRPVLSLTAAREPDVVAPRLLDGNPKAREVFDRAVREAWEAKNALLDLGVPAEQAIYVLPNATAIRFVESGDLLFFLHKWVMRTCFNAQEEIYRGAMDEVEQVREVHPRLMYRVGPPCVVRHKLARPVCTEGEHFCGVPVWLDFPGAVRRL
jgi:thymidylate synthase ThyX